MPAAASRTDGTNMAFTDIYIMIGIMNAGTIATS